MAFGLIEIDSQIIKFEQVGPDICYFGNMQTKNCYWVKFSTPSGNDDTNLF